MSEIVMIMNSTLASGGWAPIRKELVPSGNLVDDFCVLNQPGPPLFAAVPAGRSPDLVGS
jgi:hypothetical protein